MIEEKTVIYQEKTIYKYIHGKVFRINFFPTSLPLPHLPTFVYKSAFAKKILQFCVFGGGGGRGLRV